jgi:uncharacterized repeat protein (TIGR03806 family)
MKSAGNYYSINLALGLLLLVFSCEKKQDQTTASKVEISEIEAPLVETASLDFSQIPFKNLSDYGFFKGKLKSLDPDEGVLFYEPASSLFTDYAYKSRFIWMPEGTAARIRDDIEGSMDFPDNTVIIKNFYYPADFRKPEADKRIIETRLMVKRNGIWEAFSYVWKDDQSDAVYKVVGAEIEVGWTDLHGKEQVINYIVPNKNQCKSCHNEKEQLVPIGVKAKHLNHEIIFAEGEKNQLVKWQEMGYLSDLNDPTTYPSMVDYNISSHSLELRAKAYLDINCGHCHRADGPASTSGLFLTYEETDPLKLGINKTPVAAGFGAGTFKYDIVPGQADQSILTYRMSTNQVGAAMPEIGRVTVHQEGLELIREWINGMK